MRTCPITKTLPITDPLETLFFAIASQLALHNHSLYAGEICKDALPRRLSGRHAATSTVLSHATDTITCVIIIPARLGSIGKFRGYPKWAYLAYQTSQVGAKDFYSILLS